MAGIKSNLQRLTSEYISDKAQKRQERAERLQRQEEARAEREAVKIAKQEARGELLNRFEKFQNINNAYIIDVKKALLKEISKSCGALTALEAEKIYYKTLNEYKKAVEFDKQNRSPTAEEIKEYKSELLKMRITKGVDILYKVVKFILLFPLIGIYIFGLILPHKKK